MKKNILSTIFIIGIVLTVQAQRPQQFEVRVVPEVSLPLGNFSKVANTGIGGSIKGSYSFKSPGHLLVSLGYQHFGVKTLVPGVTSRYTIIPLMIGYRRDVKKVFLESQVGAGIYSLKATSGTASVTDSNVNFTYSQSIGYDFGNYELLIRYQAGDLKRSDRLSVLGIGMNFAF